MKKIKYRTFDESVVERLKKDPRLIGIHLQGAIEDYRRDGEIVYLLIALKNIVKAKGICYVAKKSGITRQALWKALSLRCNPKLSTLNAILNTLGYQISFTPKKAHTH